MQKDKLKQNVKSYAQKFEDGGLRLLKKSQKGVIHAIFSRFGLVLLLLLLQVGLLVSIFRWFGNLLPHYFGGSVVVTAAMVLYLLNSKMDNSAKITWMVVIALFPVVVLLCEEQRWPQHPAQTAAGTGRCAAHPAAAKPIGRPEAGSVRTRRGVAGDLSVRTGRRLPGV